MKNTAFESILLFVKPTAEAEALLPRVQRWATAQNITTYRVKETVPQAPSPLALVLGGDGTMLSAIAKLYGQEVPLAGINLGHLGFLTEMDKSGELENYLDTLLAGKEVQIDARPYYTCSVTDETGTVQESWPFVNDITLLRHPDNKMLNLSLTIRENPVTTTRADGMIISTPTGSTAYNLSAGGPIVHPGSNSLVLTPICPHTLSFRPVIVPPENIQLSLASPEEALLSLDGRQNYRLAPGSSVHVTQSAHHFTLCHGQPYCFFQVLRQKMGWDNK